MHNDEKKSLVLLGAILVVGFVAYSVNAQAKGKAKAPTTTLPPVATNAIYRVTLTMPEELKNDKEFIAGVQSKVPSARVEGGDLVFESQPIKRADMTLEVGKYFQLGNYSFKVKAIDEVTPDD